MKRNFLNNFIIALLRKILKATKELNAKLTGKGFYCKALSGMSDYSISINCDMSVSCSCQDHDGSGYMGSLMSENFADIFNGPIAKKNRYKLAGGNLPLLLCTTCRELRAADKNKVLFYAAHYSFPKNGIMIENTVCCNMDCVSCNRSLILNARKKRNLSLEDVKKVSLLIKQNNIEFVNFFKLGEPFLSPTIYEEIKIIREDNPGIKICTSTNGMLLDNVTKREAALMLDHIIFSIDGNNERTLQKYQRNSSFKNSYSNMKELVRYKASRGLSLPIIEWRYLLFNWNDKKSMILEAIDLANESGIDIISFLPAINPIYGISWRYYLSGFFKTIRQISLKDRNSLAGIRLDLKKGPVNV